MFVIVVGIVLEVSSVIMLISMVIVCLVFGLSGIWCCMVFGVLIISIFEVLRFLLSVV